MSDETAAVPRSPAGPAMVLLGLPLGVSRQRRWTILLRLLLLLPLIFVGLLYGLVGLALAIAAWFCALFTKRVPDRIQETLTGILRWTARVYAYDFLLTDRWPGAHLAFREGDSTDVQVDHVELRRSAVFFRAVLAVPVAIVQSVLTQGVWPFVLCMWIVGLIRGRCPKTLHQALALVLRFNTRATAYQWLLTPTMPFRRTFGDGVEGTYVAPPPAGTDAEGVGGVTSEEAPAVSAIPLEGAPDDDRETLPATWIVRRRVKYVIVWMIVIGALTASASDLASGLIIRSSQRNLVISTNNEAAFAVADFETTAHACVGVACVQRAARLALGSVTDAAFRLSGGWIGAQSTLYLNFQEAMFQEESTLSVMSLSYTSLAAEQGLNERLVGESRNQYAAVTALLRTM